MSLVYKITSTKSQYEMSNDIPNTAFSLLSLVSRLAWWWQV